MGDVLYSDDGEELSVRSVILTALNLPVYNLTVDAVHTYFVGKEGVLSHNASICRPIRISTSAKNHILRGDISP